MIKLKSLISKDILNELEFTNQASFDAYKKRHKMKPDTQVKIAGKETTAGEASKDKGLLQKLGVAARNHISDGVWINAGLKGMEPAKQYVVSDVRFTNEAAIIKACGGELWHIERHGVGPVNNHVSENSMVNYSADRSLLNSGTKEELETLVKLRLDSYLASKNN